MRFGSIVARRVDYSGHIQIRLIYKYLNQCAMVVIELNNPTEAHLNATIVISLHRQGFNHLN